MKEYHRKLKEQQTRLLYISLLRKQQEGEQQTIQLVILFWETAGTGQQTESVRGMCNSGKQKATKSYFSPENNLEFEIKLVLMFRMIPLVPIGRMRGVMLYELHLPLVLLANRSDQPTEICDKRKVLRATRLEALIVK